MTGDLWDVFRVGRVRRWAASPDMAHVSDPVDGHGARVAKLILALHPDPSRALLIEALCHDDGEAGVGDLARPAKAADPELAVRLEKLEIANRVKLWGEVPSITADDTRWLRLCDRLDAWMVMVSHRSDLRFRDDWKQERAALEVMADELGCGAPVREVLL